AADSLPSKGVGLRGVRRPRPRGEPARRAHARTSPAALYSPPRGAGAVVVAKAGTKGRRRLRRAGDPARGQPARVAAAGNQAAGAGLRLSRNLAELAYRRRLRRGPGGFCRRLPRPLPGLLQNPVVGLARFRLSGLLLLPAWRGGSRGKNNPPGRM